MKGDGLSLFKQDSSGKSELSVPVIPHLDSKDIFHSVYNHKDSSNSKSSQHTQKTQENKVSFFELARFLKVQESDFNFYANKEFPRMKQIRIFGPGEAFGEIALMTKSRRTGTMVCKEDSHVMTLRKDGFDKIMGYYNNVIISERVSFFREFEFMRFIPESKLMVLLHETKILYFQRNQNFYSENEQLTHMYFLKEGEVSISQKVYINPLHQTQSGSNQKGQNSSHPETIDTFSIKSQIEQKKQKRLVLYQQSNSSFFGEIELLDKDSTIRYTQAQCVSLESTVYSVKKEILLQFLKRFGGYDQLIEESNKKRSLQLKIIQEFQTKKCQKIIQKNQIKYERDKRKQFIRDQLTVKNRKSVLENSPTLLPHLHQENISDQLPLQQSFINSSQISTKQNTTSQKGEFFKQPIKQSTTRPSIDSQVSYQSQQNKRKKNSQIPSSNISLQKDQVEIKKSHVGQKSIDEAITKAYFKPGVNWVNPCYRSLDSKKYSNNYLSQKLTVNSNNNEDKTPQKSYCQLVKDYLKQQKDNKQNESFPFFVQGNVKQNQKTQTSLLPSAGSRRSSLFYQNQSHSPKSNRSSNTNNNSLSHFKDSILDGHSPGVAATLTADNNSTKLNSIPSPSARENSSHFKDFSYTVSNYFKESSASPTILPQSLHQINLTKRKSNRKSLSTQYQEKSFTLDQEKLISFSQENFNPMQIIENKENTSTTKDHFYKKRLRQIVNRNQNSAPNLKEQMPNIFMPATQTSGFFQTNMSQIKTQKSFTTTIRKENFSQNNFFKQIKNQKELLQKIEGNSQINTLSILQDNMFKTTKQLRQELQTQAQIKTTILQSFIKDNCEGNSQGGNNNQLDLLYNDPIKAKALQKAIFAKLIPFQKKQQEVKQKHFNTIHIEIIQKLNINS